MQYQIDFDNWWLRKALDIFPMTLEILNIDHIDH